MKQNMMNAFQKILGNQEATQKLMDKMPFPLLAKLYVENCTDEQLKQLFDEYAHKKIRKKFYTLKKFAIRKKRCIPYIFQKEKFLNK